jgi:hypothetical protein
MARCLNFDLMELFTRNEIFQGVGFPALKGIKKPIILPTGGFIFMLE